MNRDQEPRRHRLRSGAPCVKHRCIHCCVETRMPLSNLDIDRILKLGHKSEDFTVNTEEGLQLKNRSGRCVFLSQRGCKIYHYKPEGCRLYPLIYDEDRGKAVLDDLCPYGCEFEVKEDDVRALNNLLERLKKEKEKGHLS
jgi:Fe-S-cluster containining protein